MERRFGSEPDPEVRAKLGESRSFRRIQGGDAAKAVEESTQDSVAHQGSFGMTLRATRGARFELEKKTEGSAEARPVSSSVITNSVTPEVSGEQHKTGDAAGITKKLFRKLFQP